MNTDVGHIGFIAHSEKCTTFLLVVHWIFIQLNKFFVSIRMALKNVDNIWYSD